MIRRAFTHRPCPVSRQRICAELSNSHRLVVGFTPGGVSDVLARAMSAKAFPEPRPQVVVDKPGAGDHGIGSIAKSAPEATRSISATPTRTRSTPASTPTPVRQRQGFASSASGLDAAAAGGQCGLAGEIGAPSDRIGESGRALNYLPRATATRPLAGETFKPWRASICCTCPTRAAGGDRGGESRATVAFIFSTCPAALRTLKER